MCTANTKQFQQQGGVPPDIVQNAMREGVPPSALKQLTEAGGKQLPNGQAPIPKQKSKGK